MHMHMHGGQERVCTRSARHKKTSQDAAHVQLQTRARAHHNTKRGSSRLSGLCGCVLSSRTGRSGCSVLYVMPMLWCVARTKEIRRLLASCVVMLTPSLVHVPCWVASLLVGRLPLTHHHIMVLYLVQHGQAEEEKGENTHSTSTDSAQQQQQGLDNAACWNRWDVLASLVHVSM